jgi:hypothetical protein
LAAQSGGLYQMSDPWLNPQAGDCLINASRTVIRRFDDLIVFGIERNGSKNCGAYTCSLEDWRDTAALTQFDRLVAEFEMWKRGQ